MVSDKLLVSCYGFSQLFIYCREGCHLLTITIEDNDKQWDATWTPCGNIVYKTRVSYKVVVMSQSIEVIATHTQMTGTQCLCVSSD